MMIIPLPHYCVHPVYCTKAGDFNLFDRYFNIYNRRHFEAVFTILADCLIDHAPKSFAACDWSEEFSRPNFSLHGAKKQIARFEVGELANYRGQCEQVHRQDTVEFRAKKRGEKTPQCERAFMHRRSLPPLSKHPGAAPDWCVNQWRI